MSKDQKFVLATFISLVALDLVFIGFFIYRLHPNFLDLFKHLAQ